MILPITLSTVAAAALITMWHMARIGRTRAKTKINFGDGGDPVLTRKMRAQLNFVESAPFILLLIGGIELAGRGTPWLPYVAALWVVARILHALGMDRETQNMARGVGVLITMLTLLGLAIYAALIAAGIA